MANRKGAIEFIAEYVEKLSPGSGNSKLMRTYLEGLSDKAFHELMLAYRAGEDFVRITIPNLTAPPLRMENILALGDELGHKFFQHLWLTDPNSGTVYRTPKPVMVIDLPKRRQAQTLIKKISIPEDNKHVDELTGQPTGASKGSKISFNELQILFGNGHDKVIEELIKWRGGDEKGYQAMTDQLLRTGEADLDSLAPLAGRVKSTESLDTLLLGMNLDSTLVRGGNG